MWTTVWKDFRFSNAVAFQFDFLLEVCLVEKNYNVQETLLKYVRCRYPLKSLVYNQIVFIYTLTSIELRLTLLQCSCTV